MPENLVITVLGSGTSVGVPTIGCSCAVCRSPDPRDKRLRPSIVVGYRSGGAERNVLIDTTPDLRRQALDAGLKSLDAILYTHDHADHIMGLDDVRPFNYGRTERLPIYASEETLRSLRRVFPYAFAGESGHPGGVPRLTANAIDGEMRNGGGIDLFGLEFKPVKVHHGPKKIVGFRFGSAAYVTDQTGFPEESLPLLEDLDVLFLGALRHIPHPMHSTVEQALAWVARLRPRRAFLTHICHDLGHEETSANLPQGVAPAYDGLRIRLED